MMRFPLPGLHPALQLKRAEEEAPPVQPVLPPPPIRAALVATADLDPARAVRARQLAADLGLPEELILAAPERAEEEALARKLERQPSLAAWASQNRTNAVYARTNAAGLAGLFNEFNRPRDFQHEIQADYNPLEMAFTRLGQGFTNTGVTMGGALLALLEWQLRQTDPAQALPKQPGQPTRIESVTPEEYATVKAQAEALRASLVSARAYDVPQLKTDSTLGNYALDVVEAGPQFLGSVGAGLLGGPVGAGAFMSGQIAGGQYLDLTKEGVDPDRALAAGLINAAVQAPMEAFSLGRFFNIFKAKGLGNIAKKMGEAVLTDVATETAQGLPELFTEKWAKWEDVTWSDVGEALWQGFYEGLTLAPYSLLGGAGAAVRANREENRAAAWQNRMTQLYAQAQALLPDRGGAPAVLESALLATGPEMRQLAALPFSGLEEAAREGVDLITPLGLREELQTAESDRVFFFTAASLLARLNPEQFTAAMKAVRRSAVADSLIEAGRKSKLTLEELSKRAAAQGAAWGLAEAEARNAELRARLREETAARRERAAEGQEAAAVDEGRAAEASPALLGTGHLNAQAVESFFQTALAEVAPEAGEALKGELLGALGLSPETWSEAVAAGGDVAVNLDAALPLMADNALWDGLVDLVSGEPAGLTREMEADLAEMDIPPAILERAGADVTPKTRGEMVKNLRAAGRSEAQAKRETEILSRMASTLARITGADPNKMIRETFRFGKEMAKKAEASYHQSAEKRRKFEALTSPEVNSATVKSIPKGERFIQSVADWLGQQNLFGKYTNTDSGMTAIQFDHESVGSVISHWARDGKVALLQIAPGLIRDGIFLETQPRNEQGLLSHIFAAKATVDEKPYVVGFVVREDINGRRYYDHSLTEISALDQPRKEGKAPKSAARANPVNRESISSIVQKHLGVKSELTLEQPAYNGGPRGRTDILDDGTLNVVFTQSQDASTAVHEFAHLLRELARQTLETPPEKIVDQAAFDRLQEGWRDAETWLAKLDDEAAFKAEYDRWLKKQHFGGRAFETLSPEEKAQALGRAKHEHFARGFETYLMEGKAPTAGLKKLFSQMKKWLLKLYGDLAGLGVELNDDVRRFFDSLLATEEELLVENWRGEMGLTSEDLDALREVFPAEVERALQAADRARAEAEQQITQARLKEHEKMRRGWWRAAWAAAREAPSQQRLNEILKQGGISLASLRAGGYGDSRIQGSDTHTIQALVRIRPGLVSDKPGLMGFDEWFEHFDYENSDDFIQDLLNTPTLQSLAEDYVAEREAEWAEYYELESGLTEAEIAAWDEELKLWAKYMGEAYRPGSAQALKAAIKAQADAASIDELIRLNQKEWKDRLKGIQKEARAAGKEAKGRLLKQRQEMALRYREQAERAREIAKFEAKAKRLIKQKVAISAYKAGGIRPDFHYQIKNLLAAAGIGRPVEAGESLADFVARLAADGAPVEVAAGLVNGTIWEKAGKDGQARRRTWRSLSYLEFSDLRDAVENLTTLGRRQQLVRVDGKLESEDAAAEQIVAEIAANHKIAEPRSDLELLGEIAEGRGGPGLWGKVKGLFSYILKAQAITNELDGQKLNGLVQRMIYQPINHAYINSLEMGEEMTNKLRAVIERTVGSVAYQSWAGRKAAVRDPASGMVFTLSRAQIMAAALNSGNVQNLKALMNYRVGANNTPMSQEIHQAILDNLTRPEWDFVQGVWDFLDFEMFPKLDALTRRSKGIPLPKVEAAPLMTKFGELRGGYYPLIFDHRFTEEGAAVNQAKKETAESLRNLPTLFSPSEIQASATIKRVGGPYKGLKPLLDLGALTRSLTENIQDLAFREASNDVWRLLKRPDVRAAIEGALDEKAWLQLKLWLRGTLRAERVGAQEASEWLGRLRRSVTMMNLGAKVSVIALQVTGITQSMHLLGTRWTGVGVKEYFSNPAALADGSLQESLYKKSTLLRLRNEQGYDRDIADLAKNSKDPLFKTALEKLGDGLFWPIKWLDQQVANCVWLGGYLRAKNEGQTEAQAIDDADALLSLTQPTGAAKDLSYAQHGGGYGNLGKLMTMFQTYFSGTQNLLWLLGRETRRELGQGRKFKAAWVASRGLTILVLLPAIFQHLMQRLPAPWPDDDEEAGEMAADLGRGIAGNLTGGLPVVKDFVNYILGGSRNFRMSPVEAAAEAIGGATKAVIDLAGDQKHVARDVSNIIRAGAMISPMLGGPGLPIPTGQVVTTAEGIENFNDADNAFEAVYRLFIRKPPK